MDIPQERRKKTSRRSRKVIQPAEDSLPVSEAQELPVASLPVEPAGNGHYSEAVMWDSEQMHGIVKFTLAHQVYGLPIHEVIEVVRMVAFITLPEAPAGMLGLINFRGQVIPLIDLRWVMGQPLQPITLTTPILVCRTQQRLVGLLVDEVKVVSAAGHQTRTPAAGLKFVTAISYSEDETVLLVKLEDIQIGMQYL